MSKCIMKKLGNIKSTLKNITPTRQNKANAVSIERNQTTRFFPRRQNSNLQIFRDPATDITIKTDSKTIRTIWKYGGLKQYLEKTKRSKLTAYGKQLKNKMVSFTN